MIFLILKITVSIRLHKLSQKSKQITLTLKIEKPNQDDISSESDEEETRHPLEDQFVAMFPFTPRGYIRKRLANIQNSNPDAVARLTEELLRNPTPPKARLVTGMKSKMMRQKKKLRSGKM